MIIIYCFFILIIYRINEVQSTLLGDGTLVIGLFSIVDQTPANGGAGNLTPDEQGELMRYSKEWFEDNDYIFESHNVGESTLNLSQIVVDLMTNKKYFNEQPIEESADSKVAAFVVHLTAKLLNRLQMFLQGLQIPIFSLSSEIDFKHADYNVYYHFLYWMRGYDDLLNMAPNAYGEVIFFKEKQPKNHREFHKDFKYLLKRLRRLEISYRLYRYMLDVNAATTNIDLDKVVQLEANITRILNSSRCICNRRLILISNKEDLRVIYLALEKHNHAFDARVGFRWFYPNYKNQFNEKNERDSIFLRHYIHSIFTEIHKEYLDDFQLNGKLERLNILNDTFFRRNTKTRTFSPKCNCTCTGDSTSYLHNCPPGEVNTYKNLTNTHNSSEETYGYICSKCPNKDLYKPNSGNQSCKICPSDSKVNAERTKCIKIERKTIIKYVKFSNKSTISLLFFASLGIILCIAFAAIFIKYRETPIVTTSRFRTTLIHFAVFFVIFCVIPIAYIGKPNPFCCILRPIIIAILYNLNISILLSKSNKMLSAVSSKVKITKAEMRRERIGEIFFVIMNLVIGALIISIVNVSIPLEISKTSSQVGDITKIYLHCKTEIHLYASIGFTMVLKFLCFVQAFRCRHLPNILNEAWIIVYGSFIAMFLCAILLVVRFSKTTNNLEKEQITMNWILILNLVLFLVLYGWRTYWIVFQPHKNTREHFRAEMLRLMKEKAEKIGRKNAKAFYKK
uniref:G-protein coupled receptors family 3 profile domain-containing protein n=1 Tax=Clytia hemisphaerica TaxID=252671 RepID=A0A7M5XEY2_9CNID